MIDGGSEDVNDYDQVTVSVQPPTIAIPIPSEIFGEDDDSDKSYLPPPPASLNSVALASPVSNGSHYQSIGSKTTEEVRTVTKNFDHSRKGGCSQFCSSWCVMLWTIIIALLVFGLVFFKEELSEFVNGGEDETSSPQGNLTIDQLLFTDLINYYDLWPIDSTTSLTLSPSFPSSALTSSTPTTTTTTVTSTSTTVSTTLPPTTTTITTTRAYRSTSLTMPYGWNQPIKVNVNVTASAFSANSSSLSSTETTTGLQLSTTTTTFEEKDKNVFGNMSIFLSDKKKFVVSPFILNYILSFIGKFGDATTKSAILHNYFKANDIYKMYDYFGNLKDDFQASKYHNPWFSLNAFISGDNPTKAKFMEEVAEVDQIPVYPSSSKRSYETYYNEMIKKNSYDKENYQKFFQPGELKANPQKLVGFSHLQSSQKFRKYFYNRIEGEEFQSDSGKTYPVDMFVTYSAHHDFEEHRLYQIQFADDRYTFFIIHNKFNTSVPNISLSKILKAIKNGSKNETAVCVPEILQQNTYDISHFIDLSAGKELYLRTPFDQPKHNSIVDKYYQAIRFDVRAEGLNFKTREFYEPFTYDCTPIDRTFIYGIFYNDKKNPGQEALLYYAYLVIYDKSTTTPSTPTTTHPSIKLPSYKYHFCND